MNKHVSSASVIAAGGIKPVRCAIYTRKSSEEGLGQEFNSLHAQREACEAYVMSQAGEGWAALPAIYDDGGYSGGSMERPALQRLLADIEARRIDVVVVYKVDRLTRSLSDFARIVETFDRLGTSFVSVTQAFNTTTSMGRLTLNVLLSFAQFEREVTGERIRDKIAASKQKGLWMGGSVPLGYEPDSRSLRIVPEEADIVRHIYERYLVLGSVHLLRDELERDGYRSKRWTARSGNSRGGVPFGRGALFHLLSNRLYLGEVPHKGAYHPGRHEPIIEPELFARVEEKLLQNAGPKRRKRASRQAIVPQAHLTGLVFDDRGNAMSPAAAFKKSGLRYRYYVSSAVQCGGKGKAGSLPRVPAKALEDLVLDRGQRLGLLDGAEDDARGDGAWRVLRSAILRIMVAQDAVHVYVRRDRLPGGKPQLTILRVRLPATDQLVEDGDDLVIATAVRLQKRGGARLLIGPGGEPAVSTPAVDPVLMKALVRAEAWKRQLLDSKAPTTLEAIAAAEGVQPSYARRMLRLAFLASDLKRAIIDGKAPTGLTLQRLMTKGVPDLWSEQRQLAVG